MATLYEIDSTIKTAIDSGFVVDPDTGEILDGAEQLEALEADRALKIENTALYIKNLISDVEAIKTEEAALHDRRTVLENKAGRLKNYLSDSLRSHEEDRFETARCVLSFRRSKAVEISDERNFVDMQRAVGNMEFLVVNEPTINKKAISEAIKGGRVVPGCQVVERQNLQVR